MYKHIFFAIKIDIFKICLKSIVFPKYNAVKWLKTLNVTPSFTALILLLLFQFIKICLCYGFTFTNFFFFLTATNVLATSWLTFSDTRITVCFFYFLILFSHGSLMEINSTHVPFRGWIILCFDDEKKEDNNTFKDNT